jgi:hypothetical protein
VKKQEGKNIKQQISNGLLTVKMSALRIFSADVRQSFVAVIKGLYSSETRWSQKIFLHAFRAELQA